MFNQIELGPPPPSQVTKRVKIDVTNLSEADAQHLRNFVALFCDPDKAKEAAAYRAGIRRVEYTTGGGLAMFPVRRTE